MKHLAIILVCCSLFGASLCAQSTEPDIKKYVAAISDGNAEEVRNELPGLVTKYPNHPGVMYLQGLLTREGSEAIRTYQSVVDNYPESEWADDALYRIYQFYYALGLYRTADIKMKQLADRYPNSPYVKNALAAQAAQPADTTPAPQPPATEHRAPAERPPVILPPAEAAPAQADTAIAVHFALQVGAFGVQTNAQTLKERCEAFGYPVEMISKVKDTRSLFLIWVGNYATYDEARAAGQDVKRKMGVDAIVVSR
jgi:hypothetical protein